MRHRRVTDEVGIVLTYDDFYKRQARVEDLVALLQQFAVEDWLCQLARLSILLAGQNSRSPKWADAFLQNFTPPEQIQKVNGWFRDLNQKGITATVPSERDVGILIELAVLHAPSTASRLMEFPKDAVVVFDALLMVASLAQPKLELLSDELTVSACATLWLRSLCPDPLTVAAHGYHLFEILSPNRSSDAVKWATAFRGKTGHSIDDYFAGGFGIIVELLQQSPEEIGRRWNSVMGLACLKNHPRLVKPMQAYTDVRAATIDSLRESILSLEKYPADLGRFNLIALKKFPLVKCHGADYPLYLNGVASSLLDGIYHELLLMGDDNACQRKEIGGLFGQLHEKDILNSLQAGFPGRLLRNPRLQGSGENEAADGLLLCAEGLVVIQIKGCHTPAQHKFRMHDAVTLQGYFTKIGFQDAIEQLRRTIHWVRSNSIQGLDQYWTRPETVIQPVIVTFETVPQFSLLGREINRLVESARIDRYVLKPILLASEDIERISIPPDGVTLWNIFTEHSAGESSKTPFHNYLNDIRIAGGELSAYRRRQMLAAIAGHFGWKLNDGT